MTYNIDRMLIPLLNSKVWIYEYYINKKKSFYFAIIISCET
jgi:hypothetical protein